MSYIIVSTHSYIQLYIYIYTAFLRLVIYIYMYGQPQESKSSVSVRAIRRFCKIENTDSWNNNNRIAFWCCFVKIISVKIFELHTTQRCVNIVTRCSVNISEQIAIFKMLPRQQNCQFSLKFDVCLLLKCYKSIPWSWVYSVCFDRKIFYRAFTV